MKEEYEVEFYSEVCCDFCNEIIHNHFTCPVCKDDWAGTGIYMDLYDDKITEFTCEECGSSFTTIDGSALAYPSSVVKKIQTKENPAIEAVKSLRSRVYLFGVYTPLSFYFKALVGPF